MEHDLIGTKKDVDYLKEGMSEVKTVVANLDTKFDNHVASMDDRFAKKTEVVEIKTVIENFDRKFDTYVATVEDRFAKTHELVELKKHTERRFTAMEERMSKIMGALWLSALGVISALIVEVIRIVSHT
jgi:uncharacterized protein YlxP (DUF503 family)